MSMKYCPFLNDIGGFFSSRMECRRTEERIESSDPVYKTYCSQEYNYEKCPNFLPPKENSDCYLTSACTEAMGLTDDCRELSLLRSFRDNWLAHQPGGKAEITRYYEVAPGIVSAIRAQGNAKVVFQELYNGLVMPCYRAISKGNFEEAHILYRAKALELEEKYL